MFFSAFFVIKMLKSRCMFLIFGMVSSYNNVSLFLGREHFYNIVFKYMIKNAKKNVQQEIKKNVFFLFFHGTITIL